MLGDDFTWCPFRDFNVLPSVPGRGWSFIHGYDQLPPTSAYGPVKGFHWSRDTRRHRRLRKAFALAIEYAHDFAAHFLAVAEASNPHPG